MYRIPNGITIPPRGFVSFDQNQLGFQLFAGGETVYFWSTDRTRVIDVIDFRGASNNITSGRFPDGGPITYGLNHPTRNAPNAAPMRYPVVISEIMYNPPSGSSDDEYIEIHNRGSQAVDLSGWEFIIGISYLFPTNAITMSMPAGAYWVVAKNPDHLMTIYPNLTTNNTFGPYGGALANGGERVTLAAADYDRVSNGGVSEDVRLNVPVSDVNYFDGGKWTSWSDGQGSSLELIDVEADPHLPSNWADSNDTGESQWTSIEMNVPPGVTLGSPINDRLNIIMEGIGECLVDEVEVRADNGPNLVPNGGFESGLSGWVLQGSHDFSTIENVGFAGSQSLHVRAGSRGDNQSNRILSPPLTTPVPTNASIVSLRVKAKWLRGHPELLLRLHGSATEAYGRMAVPRLLGTPGMQNSRFKANIGPAVYDVKHSPPLPAANDPVVVTARAFDPQGLGGMTLHYRVDPTPTYTDVTMVDDGSGSDAVANDGIYTATIPPQEDSVIVAFYVEARDGQNATGTFPKQVFPEAGFTRCWPNDAVARECVVRWGEVQMPGDFATYHLWLTSVNSNRWATRDAMNNLEMDGTFVYNNSRIIYDALPLYSGSPWHRTNSTTGPAGPNRVDYEMNFPDDDPLLGATDFVLNNPGNPNVLTVSDLSAVSEQTVYKIFEAMGLPNNHRRYIHFFLNGSQRSTAYEREGNFIFEDSQQPNGDMIDEWFPDDAGGQLFKVEDWFEFENDGFNFEAYHDADLARRTIMVDGQPTFVPAPYRFMFRKRSIGVGNSADEYSVIYALINAVSPADNPDSPTVDPDLVSTAVDWEAWMRFFAIERAVGNFDSFGWERGKNDYLYHTANGFVNMAWDIDYGLGLGRPVDAPLFASNEPRVAAMFNTPAIARAYWRAFADLVAGPFSNEYLDPFIDERAAALTNSNVNIDLDAVAAIKTYIADRRAFLEEQLATVQAPFAVDGPASFSTDDNLLILTGTAPVEVKDITLNGVVYPITWTSVSNFLLRVVVDQAVTTLDLAGVDRFGNPLESASQQLTVNYTGPVIDPVGALVISELMFAPDMSGGQFLEIQNRSEFNFDLSGWRVDGVNLTFSPGSIVTNGQTIVLAQNKATFVAAYGSVPVFATFGGSLAADGEAVALIRPGPMGEEMINGVHYEAQPPWPIGMTGESLQLVDVDRDNRRPSNWAFDSIGLATPGAPNSVAAGLPAYDPVWLNEVETDNLIGLVDNVGEYGPWLELYNAGSNSVSLDGYYLADNYTNDLLQWQFPPGIELAPGEFKVIWADGQPEQTTITDLHTDFRLDYDGKLALVRLVGGEPQVTDCLTWITPGANASYGDVPDGQSVYRFRLHKPTPLANNEKTVPPVFINEWMASNVAAVQDPSDHNYDDWFELYNAGPEAVDLGGYYLSDDALGQTKYAIPDNGRYVIPAGGFLLVWADNDENQNGGNVADLHVNFKLAADAGIIQLTAPDGTNLLDYIAYGQQLTDVSEGAYSDGARAYYVMDHPTPTARNTVAGVNTPPMFPPLARQYLAPGERVTLLVRASDPEILDQTLTYSFEPARDGAAINQSGLFRWIVPTNQAPGDYVFILRATDDGVPPRTGTGLLDFTIVSGSSGVPNGTPPPVIQSIFKTGGQATFTIQTVPGHTYRVQYADDLEAPNWLQLDRDFVAANPIASLTDGMFMAERFYRVELVY